MWAISGLEKAVSDAFLTEAEEYSLQFEAGGLSLSIGKTGLLLGSLLVRLSRGFRLKMLAFRSKRLGIHHLPRCNCSRSLGRGWRSGSNEDGPAVKPSQFSAESVGFSMEPVGFSVDCWGKGVGCLP